MYAPIKEFLKLAELKGEIGKYKTIVEDFITPLSVFDRKGRQKIRKNIEDLSNTINQLIDM